MQVWWEKILQRHSCHNSSQQGARIGDLHHLSDSSRLVTPLTGGYYHYINTRCIDFAHCAPRPAHSVHPAARAGQLKPSKKNARVSGLFWTFQVLAQLLGIFLALFVVDLAPGHRTGPASARFPPKMECEASAQLSHRLAVLVAD